MYIYKMMKKLLLFLTVLIISEQLLAQAPPQGINYQAIAYDVMGGEIVGTDISSYPVSDQTIGVRFTIIEDQVNGTEIYQESHEVDTDENGLFNLVIGQGTVLSADNFPAIDWGTGLHFLKVEIAIDNDDNYTDMGTTQFWSVPYALYTEIAENGIESIFENGDGTVTFTYVNGYEFTLDSSEGPAGADGNGIANTIDNGDGTITFEYDDGSTYTTGDLTGPAGISLNWLGTFATAPAAPDLNDAYYNSTDGISYVWDGTTWQIVAQDGSGGTGGANTLNQAYNEGGPGAGRVITVDNGSVEINGSGSTNPALEVNSSVTGSSSIFATNTATGLAGRFENTNPANTFAAIQAEINSTDANNSAVLGSNFGAGYAIAGQIPNTATGGAAVFGNNLRTTGGSGVSGIGVNGVVGEATAGDGFGIYGNNPSLTGLAVGTYGIGFNGVYGQTYDVINGWSGYFTADLGVDGGGYSMDGWFTVSDERLKSEITKIPNALERILQVEGKY